MESNSESVKTDQFNNELMKSLNSFSCITGIPVTFFDSNGTITWESLQENKICKFFSSYNCTGSLCNKNLLGAIKFSFKLGEPYIFLCSAGLIKIAISLIDEGHNVGCFMAGPIIMGSLKQSTINNFFSLNSIPTSSYCKFTLFLSNMKAFTPKEITFLAVLLNSCILSSINSSLDYTRINCMHKQQSQLGINIQNYKKQNIKMKYPYNLENDLIDKVKIGDSIGAEEVLKDLLRELSLLESEDFSSIKAHIVGIFAVFERMAYLHEIPEINYRVMYILNRCRSYYELEKVSCTLVNEICNISISSTYKGSSLVIHKALKYINENYTRKITLFSTAEHLHVNLSYLSSLFKEEMKITFTEYLNNFRINKSKSLLEKTSLNIVDISFEVGFEDQSYFTKVFKKVAGVTPKEYRKSK